MDDIYGEGIRAVWKMPSTATHVGIGIFVMRRQRISGWTHVAMDQEIKLLSWETLYDDDERDRR